MKRFMDFFKRKKTKPPESLQLKGNQTTQTNTPKEK